MQRRLFIGVMLVGTSFLSYTMEVALPIEKSSHEKAVRLLIEGAFEGDTSKMNEALRQGAQLDSQQRGLTALHRALSVYKDKSIDFLLDVLEKGGGNSAH